MPDFGTRIYGNEIIKNLKIDANIVLYCLLTEIMVFTVYHIIEIFFLHAHATKTYRQFGLRLIIFIVIYVLLIILLVVHKYICCFFFNIPIIVLYDLINIVNKKYIYI